MTYGTNNTSNKHETPFDFDKSYESIINDDNNDNEDHISDDELLDSLTNIDNIHDKNVYKITINPELTAIQKERIAKDQYTYMSELNEKIKNAELEEKINLQQEKTIK